MDEYQHVRPHDILCVGLNPAFQTTLHFEQFVPGHVNRSFKKTHSIGGKGQNFAIACEQYARHDRVTILQCVGGMTGTFITQVLDEKRIQQVNVTTRKATRTCTTVLDASTGDMTELIEPPGLVTRTERTLLESRAKQLIANGHDTLRAIALCGTLPTGITGSTYAHIAQAKPDNVLLLVDACKEVHPVLATGKVDIFKINREELVVLAQECTQYTSTPNTQLSKDLCWDRQSIPTLARVLLSHYKIRWLGVTDGPDSAYLFSSATQYHMFDLPVLEEVVRSLRISDPSYDYNDTAASVSSSLPSPVALDEMIDHRWTRKQRSSSTNTAVTAVDDKTSDEEEGGGGSSSQGLDGEEVRFAHALNDQHRQQLHGHLALNELQRFCLRKELATMVADDRTANGEEDTADVMLNPLGAGDTASAVFLLTMLETRDPVGAFKQGIAAASASCLVTEQTAHFDQQVMSSICERIQVRAIDDSLPTLDGLDLGDSHTCLSNSA